METIKNIYWLFKVFKYCSKHKFPLKPKSYYNKFNGPKIPVYIKQEPFKHGWRFIAFNVEKSIIIKFPAHYNPYDVRNFLDNHGYSF